MGNSGLNVHHTSFLATVTFKMTHATTEVASFVVGRALTLAMPCGAVATSETCTTMTILHHRTILWLPIVLCVYAVSLNQMCSKQSPDHSYEMSNAHGSTHNDASQIPEAMPAGV